MNTPAGTVAASAPQLKMMSLVLALLCSSPAWARPCPAVIGLSRTGALYNNRGGLWVRQSPRVLQNVLATGCYPEGGPAATSSVTLYIQAGTAPAILNRISELFAAVGWPKEKIDRRIWNNAPRQPPNAPR